MEERNKKVRNKVIVNIIFVDLFLLGALMLAVPYKQVINFSGIKRVITIVLVVFYLSAVIWGNIKLFKALIQEYNTEEKDKILVQNNLSTERYVEVIPIQSDEYENFILGLTDIAKFYAVINDEEENVEIMVKFNNEEKYRLLEKIATEYFSYYYKLKQEKD